MGRNPSRRRNVPAVTTAVSVGVPRIRNPGLLPRRRFPPFSLSFGCLTAMVPALLVTPKVHPAKMRCEGPGRRASFTREHRHPHMVSVKRISCTNPNRMHDQRLPLSRLHTRRRRKRRRKHRHPHMVSVPSMSCRNPGGLHDQTPSLLSLSNVLRLIARGMQWQPGSARTTSSRRREGMLRER